MDDYDYDVVVDVLTKHRDSLQLMNEGNARAEMFGIMDQIRMEQIGQINACLTLWRNRKAIFNSTMKDFYEASMIGTQ